MIVRSIVGRRRTTLSVLVAAAGMVLTGCGAGQPGAAAVVGDDTISHERVDGLAEAFCSAEVMGAKAQGAPSGEIPSRGQRERALSLLLETELSQQFGEAEGVEPSRSRVSQAVGQIEQGISQLPEEQRDDLRTAYQEYVAGELTLIQIGRRSLGEDTPENEAYAEGQRLRKEFAEDLDVEVDPRYGTLEEDIVQPGGNQLSVAVSALARGTANAEIPPATAARLPASQKCS